MWLSRALKLAGRVRTILRSAIFTWLKIARPCVPRATAHSRAASKILLRLLIDPPQILFAPRYYRDGDYLRHNVAMKTLHFFLYLFKRTAPGLYDDQEFLRSIDLPVPPKYRVNARNDIRARY